MISFEDCLALCGLTKDEVGALSEYEHIPDIVAAALGQYLLNMLEPFVCAIGIMVSCPVGVFLLGRRIDDPRNVAGAGSHGQRRSCCFPEGEGIAVTEGKARITVRTRQLRRPGSK